MKGLQKLTQKKKKKNPAESFHRVAKMTNDTVEGKKPPKKQAVAWMKAGAPLKAAIVVRFPTTKWCSNDHEITNGCAPEKHFQKSSQVLFADAAELRGVIGQKEAAAVPGCAAEETELQSAERSVDPPQGHTQLCRLR